MSENRERRREINSFHWISLKTNPYAIYEGSLCIEKQVSMASQLLVQFPLLITRGDFEKKTISKRVQHKKTNLLKTF